MGSTYLVDLATVLRDAGLDVHEIEGWQHRGRSSGGYEPGRPWAIMFHHTAGAAGDGSNDARYCTFGDEDAPLTNLVIGVTGTVWLCAAGCTNTNGKGYAVAFSKGVVPDDSMNSYAIGIEFSNNGTGGPWPQAQIDAGFKASLAMCAAYGLQPDDVCTHQHWAPDRKVDPATADAVLGPWQPDPCTGAGSWSVEDLRAECRARAAGAPAVEPPPTLEADYSFAGAEDDPMFITKNGNNIFFLGNGLVYRQVFADELDQTFTAYNGKLVDWKSGKTIVGKNAVGVTAVTGMGVRIGKSAEGDTV